MSVFRRRLWNIGLNTVLLGLMWCHSTSDKMKKRPGNGCVIKTFCKMTHMFAMQWFTHINKDLCNVHCDIYLTLLPRSADGFYRHRNRPYKNSLYGWFRCTNVHRSLLTFAVRREFNSICQDLPEGEAAEQLWLIAIYCNRESTVTVKNTVLCFHWQKRLRLLSAVRPHPARPVTLRLLPWLSLLSPHALTLSSPQFCTSSSSSSSLQPHNISPPCFHHAAQRWDATLVLMVFFLSSTLYSLALPNCSSSGARQNHWKHR